jgi:hypothetical protein
VWRGISPSSPSATPGTKLRPSASCVAAPREARRAKRGGARRDRTDDLMLAKHALSQLSYGPVSGNDHARLRLRLRRAPRFDLRSPAWLRHAEPAGRSVVGLGRLELPTSRLSSARSNQLSYKPLARGTLCAPAGSQRRMQSHSAALARVRPRRKRNEDGEIPPMELNIRKCWPLMFLKRSDSELGAL